MHPGLPPSAPRRGRAGRALRAPLPSRPCEGRGNPRLPPPPERVTARERGGGKGRGNFGKRLRPPPRPRGAPSDGRAAAGAAPSHPHLLCGAPARSPRLPPAGRGCRAPRPLPSWPGRAAGAVRARYLSAGAEAPVDAAAGREEVPGGSGGQFPRENLPHSLNVNDSKRGVLPLH